MASVVDLDGVSRDAIVARAARRRFPLAVWLIVAVQAALMLGATILYPAFQSPDEPAHVDYVLAHRHGEWFDGPGQRHYQSGVLAAFDLVPNSQFQIHIGRTEPLPRSERKSFDALGTQPARSAPPNQMVQHPPLYYGLAAGFSYLLPDFSNQRFDIQVFWLRLLSIILLLPVPLLIYDAARYVSLGHHTAMLAAIIPLSNPSYLRTGASVTNDSLLTLTTMVAVALLVRIAWGDRTRRTAILLGVAWGAALLTKGFALALPPAIVAAYLVGASGPIRARIRKSWQMMAVAGSVGCGIGAWWWIRNLIVYGAVQPDGFGPWNYLRHIGYLPHGGEITFFDQFFDLLGQRTWGSLGLIDVPSLPLPLLFGLAALFVALLVASVVAVRPVLDRWRGRVELPGWTVSRAVVLVVPAVLVLGVMYWGARSAYMTSGRIPGVQMRYLVPSLLGVVVCVAVALQVMAGRLERWMPLAAFSACLVFVGGSAYRVLDVEMSGGGPLPLQRLAEGVQFTVGWAPFPASVTAGIALGSLALVVITLAVLERDALRCVPVKRRPAEGSSFAPDGEHGEHSDPEAELAAGSCPG